MKFITHIICALLAIHSLAVSLLADELSPQELEFFETKIRPVLVKSCYECHSQQAANKNDLKGGLLLDTRQGLLRGGESGPAVVLGKPDESLLLSSLAYDSFKMPPTGKLSDAIIADFRKWIAGGMADPRTKVSGAVQEAIGIDLAEGRKFWAYQPLGYKSPSVSWAATDDRSDIVGNQIDGFVIEKLRAVNLQQGSLASREVLLRRLTFDLTGLPPTVAAQNAFILDTSPDAVERVVDELLARPEFGQRWGRHWLDVVRYADSITLRGFLFPEAWRYRDYVINSFNEDRPFDQFVRQQVSGDLMSADGYRQRQEQMIATTFLTLGNSNLEDQDKAKLRMDVVDEQLDTVFRGFLGQTIGCARCHDHKFDPIPTRDYYALAGIFRNTKTLNHSNVSKWIEVPLPQSETVENAIQKFKSESSFLQKRIAQLQGKVDTNQPIVSASLSGVVVDDEQAVLTGSWQRSMSSKSYIDGGYQHDLNQGKGDKTALFQAPAGLDGEYEVRFSFAAGSNRTKTLPVTVTHAAGKTTVIVDQTVVPPIKHRLISLGRFLFNPRERAQVLVETTATTGHAIIDAVQFLPVDEADQQAQAANVVRDEKRTAAELKDLKSELEKLTTRQPQRSLVMSVQEEKEIGDTFIHVRGDVHNLGEAAPRGFLQVLPVSAGIAFTGKESGRHELGEWLADRDNPLLARVFANRIWYWLFGTGIVRSVDNFGATGELPSHPELLDYLALRLQQDQWSTKGLIREIVLSRTYRLSSVVNQENIEVDPENRLLSSMNRRRLSAECILDAMLSISGNLDRRMGGSEIATDTQNDYNYLHASRRRAVYWPVLRNSVAEVMDVFDFANPSMVVGQRDVSASAPQALFMMNSERVMDLAEKTARLYLSDPGLDDTLRIKKLVQVALGRPATPQEILLFTKFLDDDSVSDVTKEQKLAQLIQTMFASVDFRYLY
ncbi:MAG: DUF1553 domain-containing protein [Planctomycetaceae bacterium]|jgi:hypothetical protein|nr:DUF1553 domain-containing protein [Planctomycetaceae bacterium]